MYYTKLTMFSINRQLIQCNIINQLDLIYPPELECHTLFFSQMHLEDKFLECREFHEALHEQIQSEYLQLLKQQCNAIHTANSNDQALLHITLCLWFL